MSLYLESLTFFTSAFPLNDKEGYHGSALQLCSINLQLAKQLSNSILF